VTGITDAVAGKVAIHMTVEDTGIGIPKHMCAHIFGEFNQVENERNRQFDGTGLGLAITKRLVQLMNGEIWVTSEEGVGSCFGFRLEMAVDGVIDTTYPSLKTKMRRVMVVDDIPANRSILDRQLKQLQLQTVGVASMEAALAALDDTIDLIITDHKPPLLDALDFAAKLAERECKAHLMLLSANLIGIKEDPRAKNLSVMLQKPLPRRTLFTALRELKPQAAKNPPMPVQETLHSPVSAQSSARKMRVMAAEDNKTNRLVFRKMVKSLNITLKFAENGEQAVTLYQTFKPDLIFMDISMPHMDGKEATQKIRKIEQETGIHIPVVAMTAHAMANDDKSILQAGLDHYLTKPLRRAAIEEHISLAQPKDTLPVLPPPDQEVG
jgi:CheY-like chemotaxis protein